MMILAIVVSTMIIVAIVVVAIQFDLYKKYQAKRDSVCTPKRSAGDTPEAPAAS